MTLKREVEGGMARAKSKKSTARRQRVASDNASRIAVHNRARLLGVAAFTPRPLDLMAPIFQLEDRRRWHPERPSLRPFAASVRPAARIVAKQNPTYRQPSQTKAILAFAEPDRVAVCARRARRREVLHALNIAGGTGFKKRRLTEASKISCR
ncbi:MAG: hypothetical protein QXT77_07995 [Candidatus Methanomethylicaceae archaeon]